MHAPEMYESCNLIPELCNALQSNKDPLLEECAIVV